MWESNLVLMAIVIPRIRVNLSKLQINSLYIEERGGLHMPLKSDFPVNSYWLTIHDKKKDPLLSEEYCKLMERFSDMTYMRINLVKCLLPNYQTYNFTHLCSELDRMCCIDMGSIICLHVLLDWSCRTFFSLTPLHHFSQRKVLLIHTYTHNCITYIIINIQCILRYF